MVDISGYLKTIRDGQSGETVRDAIINCMRDINEDGQVKKASLVITKPDNVTYKPGKGKAFSSVTVNITGGESDPNKTIKYETLTVTELTENGTYPKEDQPDTYYDKVEVAIDWDKVSHPSNLGEEADMTTYKTDENGNKYWDARLVGYDYVKRIWIPNSIASGLPSGDYPGANATGPFKVEFYDRDVAKGTPRLLSTVTVGKGENAEILYDKVLPNVGGTFLMWNPPVNSVTKDTKTYARYTNKSTGDPKDLARSWDQVVNMSAEEVLGNYNILEVVGTDGSSKVPLNPFTYTSKVPVSGSTEEFRTFSMTNPKVKFNIRMQCVGVGENGSKTSWLAMDPLPRSWLTEGDSELVSEDGCVKATSPTDDWASCYLHQFFEGSLINALPAAIKSHLVKVPKVTLGANQYYPYTGDLGQVNKEVPSSIWIPSMREVGDMFPEESFPVIGNYAPNFRTIERAGLNYIPYWTPDFLTPRTSGSINNVCLRSLERTAIYGGTLAYFSVNLDGVSGNYYAGVLNGCFGNTNDSGIYIGFCLG